MLTIRPRRPLLSKIQPFNRGARQGSQRGAAKKCIHPIPLRKLRAFGGLSAVYNHWFNREASKERKENRKVMRNREARNGFILKILKTLAN